MQNMTPDKPRILVVDDERFNRTVLVDLLKTDYTVMLAKDGEQALKKARSRHPPGLMLLDIMMPGMDGYTVCERLKESPMTRDIPVIFVTAKQEHEDEEKGLDAGAIDYIAKPFSPAIVLARVRNHIALENARKKLAEAHAELARKNKELKIMATRDALTGLNNRFALDETMTRELHKARRHGRPLSMLIIDVDHFKQVNDTHGHQIGDQVLSRLAALLKENTRGSDVLGRWGGEEFLIICPETDSRGIMPLAENLRRCIEGSPFPIAGRITISIGVSTFATDDSVEKLIQKADKGLYRAKEHGRNQVASVPEL